MKFEIMDIRVIDIRFVKMEIAVRYEEEDIPSNFPGRNGDVLTMTFDVQTGEILDFPKETEADIYMKVCDEGTYTLLDGDRKEIKKITNDYVPNGIVPGEFGDYVALKIKDGFITNLVKQPHLKDFYPE